MADELRFERFDKSRHSRAGFDCGIAALHDYLRTGLNQQMGRDLTIGYVLAASDGTIAGYFTLSSARISVGVIPEGLGFPTKMPLPATLIGRLAVDRSRRGLGLGKALLVHALERAVAASRDVASAVVEVNAKDESARTFYAKFGFESLRDDPLHMFLPMETARAFIAGLGPRRA